MVEYELTLVTKATVSNEDLEKFIEEITKIITDGKGDVINIENWGKKQLAYEIEKQRSGVYTLFTFKSEPSILKAINKKLKISDQVLRYLTVKK
ncbi:MAG: 30S ribosomal protein S6 [Patescibacteria group bacterium]|nr:30S ribosomal protein S6 [Patescibacteria group bacterium]